MVLAPLLLAAIAATNVFGKAETPARVTSDTTFYDRKEGIAVFKGHVHVDDDEYQMHADKAFLYLTPSNTLSRIVATGDVALTNGLRRAYGEKVTYGHEKRLITLHGSEGKPARIVDSTPDGDRVVEGLKIRFWINREQVEVLNAVLSAPTSGSGSALPGFGDKLKKKKKNQ